MAQVFSYSDKYIDRQIRKAGFADFLLRYGNAALAGLAAAFTTSRWSLAHSSSAKIAWFVLWFVGYGVLFWWLLQKSRFAQRRRRQFAAGGRGEELLLQELKKLPPEYNCAYDVVFPGGGGNIDALIFGPEILVLESKHHSGELELTRLGMLRSGRLIPGRNPLEQARRAGRTVTDFLSASGVRGGKVLPVVVFTNKRAVLKERLAFPEGVAVLKLEDLRWFLARRIGEPQKDAFSQAAWQQFRQKFGSGDLQ